MVPGKLVKAIFGFCDIRAFTGPSACCVAVCVTYVGKRVPCHAETTEVLQEEIMEFVNSIANVVHIEVIRF